MGLISEEILRLVISETTHENTTDQGKQEALKSTKGQRTTGVSPQPFSVAITEQASLKAGN